MEKPLPPGFPEEPATLGGHLKRERGRRGMLQQELASLLGVSSGTLYLWEVDGTEPSVQYIPAILDFLGYDPRERPHDLPDLCRWRREAFGLSQKHLALRLGLDPSSVCRFESRKLGGRKVRERIRTFVEAGLPDDETE